MAPSWRCVNSYSQSTHSNDYTANTSSLQTLVYLGHYFTHCMVRYTLHRCGHDPRTLEPTQLSVWVLVCEQLEPTALTTPAQSNPITMGIVAGMNACSMPEQIFQSTGLTEDAITLMSTWPDRLLEVCCHPIDFRSK